MSGLIKQCRVCEKPFTTVSLKGTQFEETCPVCHNSKKRTSAEVNIVGKMDRRFLSMETRLDRLEKSQEMIPMIIGAEISTIMMDINGLTGIDLKGMIALALTEAKADISKNNALLIKKFQTKLQQQIVTLNNKIIKIMQEMEG